MSRLKTSWYSDRLHKQVDVVRWGEVGKPVLFFPTAAADAEECERFHMVDVLSDHLAGGRVKLYSVDSVAGRAWLQEDNSTVRAARVQDAFDSFVYRELVPAIRADCNDDGIEIIACGPSIGAFNALAAICRHPDVFEAAVCMSGTYDLSKFLEGPVTEEYFHSSPLHFLPHLHNEEHANRLRERFILLAHGEGNFEDPQQSWRVADVLGAKGIPNRVDSWGKGYHHDWPTWREMLPTYLDELLG